MTLFCITVRRRKGDWIDYKADDIENPKSIIQIICAQRRPLAPCLTGMTQRDGMGREVGGGFRMGNTCTPIKKKRIFKNKKKWLTFLKKQKNIP